MFYSHEILSNSQYGVSTIWLVATVGKTSHRRLSRKAIQEVNVPKACEKIIDPGAPLALRLQGNLLYGVSRVFAQQCHYMLSDATKTQSDMLTFFRVMKTSELDPKAGKAKRHQITLQDDPSFDVMNILPNFDLFTSNKELSFVPSQFSTQGLSQMTPLSQGTLSSGGNPSFIPFSLPLSSRSVDNYRLPSDLGQDSPLSKPYYYPEAALEFNPFVNDPDPISSIGLNFDGDGNLIGFDDLEPELPPLPGTELHEMALLGHDMEISAGRPGKNNGFLVGDNVLIVGEDALPDAAPFPKQPRTRKRSSSSSTDSLSSIVTDDVVQAIAPLQRGRPRKAPQMVDESDHVSRKEFLSWSRNYLENMETRRKKPRTTTPAQARKNASAFLFGNGIANIGIGQGATEMSHPLAKHFAGSALKATLQDTQSGGPEEEHRGRRRTSAEAFQDNEDETRRVRPRYDDEDEMGRGLIDDFGSVILSDYSVPEIGMEAAPPLEDHHSSVVPWSRPPSAIPGSSIRAPESAQKAHPAPSPLFPRDSALGAIERHSDRPDLVDGTGSLPLLDLQDSSLEYEGMDFPGGDHHQQATQESTGGLDKSSLQFLTYTMDKAHECGTTRPADPDRRWVNFEEIANPAVHDKRVAAQAFLHVLTLLTKDRVVVEQEGIKNNKPFGTIHIGTNATYDSDIEAHQV